MRRLEPRNLRKPLSHYIIFARRSVVPGVFKFARHFQTSHPHDCHEIKNLYSDIDMRQPQLYRGQREVNCFLYLSPRCELEEFWLGRKSDGKCKPSRCYSERRLSSKLHFTKRSASRRWFRGQIYILLIEWEHRILVQICDLMRGFGDTRYLGPN